MSKPSLLAGLTVAIVMLNAGSRGVAQPSETGERMMTSAAIKERIAKTDGGLALFQYPADSATTILLVKRDRDGEVEMHERVSDHLIAYEGDAEIIVGGTMAGARTTAAGEWRGGQITGGKTYAFHTGDMIWIPAGIPHKVVLKNGKPFEYVALKYNAAPK